MKYTAEMIAQGCYTYFNYRQNIMVPNVAWGFIPGRELDLLVIRKSGYAFEVEIKVSASDIRADLDKRHQHRHDKLKELWFAVPPDLATHPDIPTRAGVISVSAVPTWNKHKNPFRYQPRFVRGAQSDKGARKLTDQEIKKVMRLGCLRIPGLKANLLKIRLDKQRRASKVTPWELSTDGK